MYLWFVFSFGDFFLLFLFGDRCKENGFCRNGCIILGKYYSRNGEKNGKVIGWECVREYKKLFNRVRL